MLNTIGFLGCGNMGGAIARAVCKAADPQNVWLANRTAAKAEALAAELGCMPRQIQDYEEGKLYPHAITMVDLADFFNVSLDYLMGRTDCREINRGPAPDAEDKQ